MTNSLPSLHGYLSELKKQLLDSLLKIPCTATQESPRISTASTLQSLLSEESSVNDFVLACALLSSSRSSTYELLMWIPDHLSTAAETAFSDLSKAYNDAVWPGQLRNLAAELMPEIVPVLKDTIRESSVDKSDETGESSTAPARPPVGLAIFAAYQCRWLVSQIECPDLEKMVILIIPWALTCLDHRSLEVKGLISLIHVAKNVKVGALDSYGADILYACGRNIASADEIWQCLVELLALLVTCTKRDSPCSPWFHKILAMMLNHLEREPMNRDRRIAWLKFIDPVFNYMGLSLSPYFGRIFPLLFQWLHVNDDETFVLVLKRLHTIVLLTWIRETIFFDRLVDELVEAYKEAEQRKAGEEIGTGILNLLLVLQQYLGLEFETAWNKHKDNPNLIVLDCQLSLDRGGPKEGSEMKAEETIEAGENQN